MSALPVPAGSADPIASQDEAYDRVRRSLEVVTSSLLEEHPELEGFEDSRPFRDRSSGSSWNGLRTMVHISGLLVSLGPIDLPADYNLEDVAARIDRPFTELGMERCAPLPGLSIAQRRWLAPEGDVCEMIGARRIAVRAISAPFLPGSLQPAATTSPITPPPRRIR